ncbi:MAG: right-handed parallel beta-helix repeat-containing protein [Tessaracoccus sp.]|uniref:right-handed parallel beta-helix repeat-containing protein n=1 Tax=Tessaracoccus sp. TaxID=1971211 RepID=UPI001ED73E0F|nr:right-handed parallel beta-helix repeat-containing protein [Tessaracoccus sp.]MBK7820146.1 right-handed parallel beta-helix repeat-containing protein [Tessaracoccus sp.]
MRTGSPKPLFRLIGAALLTAALTATYAAPDANAAASTDLSVAADALDIGGTYSVVRLAARTDITTDLIAATKTAASSSKPRVVVLPVGSFAVKKAVRPANHVYLVAQPNTTVTWRGSDSHMLRFDHVTSGVYGGVWDGAKRGSANVFSASAANVNYSDLTVKNAANNGIAGYNGSTLKVEDVKVTANGRDGVYMQETKVTAVRLTATSNERTGLMLSKKSSGTVSGSALDGNGQGVSGSTTGKTGHGLALDASEATVSSTSMSRNKVCGISLTKKASIKVTGSSIASNGRHGVGTRGSVKGSLTKTKITKNGYNGVLATDSGTKITLKSSIIESSKKYGLSVPSKGAATLTGTTVKGSGNSNISVSGGGKLTLKASNSVTSAQGDGIAVTSKGRIAVSGADNVVSKNKANGLRLSGSGTQGTVVEKMSVKSNKQIAILVHAKGKLETVKNSVSGGKKKGVVTRSGGKVVKL